MRDNGRTPLIVYQGQPGTEAIPARSVVDLHGAHIGKKVVILFESGYPARPIVMGVLREEEGWPVRRTSGNGRSRRCGERLIVTANGNW
jgi:hypothetical protein